MGIFFCYALRIGRLAMSFQNGLEQLGSGILYDRFIISQTHFKYHYITSQVWARGISKKRHPCPKKAIHFNRLGRFQPTGF
jgi:hypothetical protein